MTVTELMALGRLLAGYLELFAECFSSRPILEHFGETVPACCRTCRGSRSSRLRCSAGRRFERCSDSCELRFGTTSEPAQGTTEPVWQAGKPVWRASEAPSLASQRASLMPQ